MDERDLDPDPLRQAAAWLAEAEAAGVPQPESAALATASASGVPAVRMVLVKGIDGRGCRFFTSRESRKGRELAENPRAAVALHWHPLGRQIRAEGRVQPLDEDETLAYWRTRPRGSRLSAWASPQSRGVASRSVLEARVEELAREHPDDVTLPPFWGGYLLVPDAVELWQHRDDRLHDRVLYTRDGDGWRRERLGP